MRFLKDERGVSVQVGVIFLFAFLVILLSINQAELVPQKNTEVEFKAYQDVQRDLIELRNEILDTRETGEAGFVEITMSVQYPTRMFAINGPPPTATLRSQEARNITILENGVDRSTALCPTRPQNRLISYDPNYNYWDHPTIYYENTVLYAEYDDRRVFLTGQNLVQGSAGSADRDITVIPVDTELARFQQTPVSIEPIPGRIDENEVTNATIKLPTRLTEEQWEELLDGHVAPADIVVNNGYVNISTAGTLTVQCSPVGLNQPPPGGRRATGTNLNPIGPGDVIFTGANTSTNPDKETFYVDLNNTANQTVNITRARATFFFNSKIAGSESVSFVEIYDPATGTRSARLQILGPSELLAPQIELSNKSTTTIRMRVDGSKPNIEEGDFVVLDLTFSSGKTGTYFIAPVND